MQPDEGVEEYLLKILVVGDIGSGKTSIIKRYVHNVFSNNYKATIGVDFALKVLDQPEEKRIVRLQLWDIAGQERFGNMTRVYYREAVAAIVVYDQTRIVTLDGAARWKGDIDSKLGPDTPTVLFANKSDATEQRPDREAMDAMCKQHGFVGWIETCAKSGTNVAAGVSMLLQYIPVLKKPEPPPSEIVQLTAAAADLTKEKSGCC